MVEKTITMSYNDYKMMSIENEEYKKRYDNLAQEKMVYLTIKDPYLRYAHPSRVNQMSGQIVEKDKLLKKMQEHLKTAEEEMKERESDYKIRIRKLEQELRQASKETVNKWWHKLLK
jgi:hypothetical protein